MKPKILPATRKRTDALRDEYRRARAFFYGATRAMDSAWESGGTVLAAARTPDQQRAAVDRLAADLAPYLAAVPSHAPAAPSRRKPAS